MTRQLRTISRQLEQLEETLNRQQKILDGIPELQAQVRRCVTAYTKDARQTDVLAALRAELGDGEAMAAHAAAAVAHAQLELDPFPHIVIDKFLPDDMGAELIRALPSNAFFKTEDMTRQELEVPFVFAPEYSRVMWNTFFHKVIAQAMVPALMEKFRPALDDFLQTHWPELGTMAEAGIRLRVSNSICAAMPAVRSSRNSRSASARPSSPIPTTNACTVASTATSGSASTSRSSPAAKPIPGRLGPPSCSTRPS